MNVWSGEYVLEDDDDEEFVSVFDCVWYGSGIEL